MCGKGFSFGPFDQCDAQWTRKELASVEELERNFGVAPLSCPAAPTAAPAPPLAASETTNSPVSAPSVPAQLSDDPISFAVDPTKSIKGALAVCFLLSFLI